MSMAEASALEAAPVVVKRKFGRPEKYDPSYCDRVIECGREGMGLYELSAKVDLNLTTIHDWERKYPDFSMAMHEARRLSQAWWEEQGKKGVWGGKEFNAAAYSLQVRNRFPKHWRDKHEVSGTIEVNHTHTINVISDLNAEEREALRMIAQSRVAAEPEPLTIEATAVQGDDSDD